MEYQEHTFKGKRLMAVSLIPMLCYYLLGFLVQTQHINRHLYLSFQFVLLISVILYLIGFWQAVKSKGYPQILFLISFTGIIGLLVILLLPVKNENTATTAA
jgi:hypothetical protein